MNRTNILKIAFGIAAGGFAGYLSSGGGLFVIILSGISVGIISSYFVDWATKN